MTGFGGGGPVYTASNGYAGTGYSGNAGVLYFSLGYAGRGLAITTRVPVIPARLVTTSTRLRDTAHPRTMELTQPPPQGTVAPATTAPTYNLTMYTAPVGTTFLADAAAPPTPTIPSAPSVPAVPTPRVRP